MSPEEQRIAIAEVCGWTPYDGWNLAWTHKNGPAGIAIPAKYLPDYLNDLNAMHEAEKVLTREQQRTYTKLLHPEHINHLSADWCVLHATAAQRAEAFLKTLNLWTKS
jgi:hypothetical protein